jgi:membrane associated rhomboid family serine protease
VFEKIEIIRRLLGTLVLAIGSLGCALQLYRFSRGQTRRVPVISLVIIGATALVTGLQFVFPEVLTALRRNREALLAGEWWRMVTPLFVQAYGWWHACVNGVAAIIFFPVAERLYGKKLWALYFIPGVVGQIFGYWWSPNAAGSSLGIAGVMGGLFAFAVLHRRELSGSAQLFALCGIAGAIALCFSRDIHGPPTVLGILLAGMITILEVAHRERALLRCQVTKETLTQPMQRPAR